MRIKIDDKIYRLKEIESGVDSLMELVEEPRYKDGDFVYEDGRIMIVKSYPNMYHANAYPKLSTLVCYNDWYGVDFSSPTFRHATEEERQILIDALKKDCKRWNAEKKCIEEIHKRKFKAGDKVKIKDGISSETQGGVYPYFEDFLDQYIGKVMTVKKYITTDIGEYIRTNEAKKGDHYFGFAENWLEPWIDEPKVGDWVVAWDVNRKAANVGILEAVGGGVFKYVVNGYQWMIAVKWDGTIEHLEKIRKG